MCPELSQCVSQDHLTRAFYPQSFVSDKFDQQHNLFLNHVPNRAPHYKSLDDECMHDAEGLRSVPPPAPSGQPGTLPYAIESEMINAFKHGEEELYRPLTPAGLEAAPSDYSLHLGCNANQLMPEIDCNWMRDVLDDLLLASHELPPLAPLNIGVEVSADTTVSPATSVSSLSSALDALSKRGVQSQLQLQLPLSSSPLGVSLPTVPSPDLARINSVHVGEHLLPQAPRSPAKTKSSSPTPEPLKIRASKRLQRDESTRKASKWPQKVNLVTVDQVEHVIRERQRRDDMSYKIATLESLLPQGPKRDRASIVHESVQYVKLLQLRVEELTSKHEKLQQKSSTKSSSGVVVIKDDLEVRASTSKEWEKPFRLVTFHVQVEGGEDGATVTNCRCCLDFLSLTVRALEQLQLQLSRSSVTKISDGSYFCVIVSKPRKGVSPVPSSSTLAFKIKSAVELKR